MRPFFTGLMLFTPLVLRAADDAPTVARQALEAWRNGDARVMIDIAAPQLKHRLRDSTLLRTFNEHRSAPIDLSTAPDEMIIAQFCAALRDTAPAQPEIEYSDDYVSTQYWGATHTEASHACVEFDCGTRSVDSNLVVRTPTEVVLEKNGEHWLLLWLPAAFDTIDSHWDGRQDVERRSRCVPLFHPLTPRPLLPYHLRVAAAVWSCDYLELRVSASQFWSGYVRRYRYTLLRVTDRTTIDRLAALIVRGSDYDRGPGTYMLGQPSFRCYAHQTEALEGFLGETLNCISGRNDGGPDIRFEKATAQQIHELVEEPSRQPRPTGAAVAAK